MKTIILTTIAMFLLTTLVFSEVAITVYNENMAVVKDTRDMNFSNGVGEIQFRDVAVQIDPTTVHFNAQGVELLEQNYQYDLVSSTKILEKYIDQIIQVVTDSKQGTDLFSGTLLSFSAGDDGDVVLQSKMGEIKIIRRSAIRDLSCPQLPEGLITRPTLVWRINSSKAGSRPAEVSYMTSGISWHAEYVAILATAETNFDLSAWVSIDNQSGATYKDAKVKLMAGEVHRAGKAVYTMMAEGDEMRAAGARPKFEDKAFADYHLYTLQRTSTLKDREVKQISLFEPASVTSTIVYTYDGSRQGERVKKELTFKNSEKDGLGKPLPAGTFRVYQQDSDKAIEFIGEDQIKHTPTDEEVKVTVGYAFDLVGKRERTETKRITDRVFQEAYTITLRNHKKDKDATIRVEDHFPGDWEILEKSHKFEKIDASTARFTVDVPVDKEVVITYRVQYTI